MLKKLLCALIVSSISVQAQAVTCSGIPTEVSTNANGNVLVRANFTGNDTRICNLNTTTNTISPVACAMMVATVTGAVTSQKNLRWTYNGVSTCIAVGNPGWGEFSYTPDAVTLAP